MVNPFIWFSLLVGKENLVSLHIKLLSRISRMMTKDEFRRKLMDAKTSEEIMEIFSGEEATYYDNL
jgi:mannitol/fructose-specific phosphotransferase system IIA component (Ntr-type)